MKINNRKIKICFVAHSSYGALAGGTRGQIGGVEKQTSLMAKWFAKRGYDVSVITWDEGQADNQIIDGVRILKICPEKQGVPVIRFLYPRWFSLVKAMKTANAHIYYHNCGEYVTGQIALWAKIKNKTFVYSVASDPDCDPNLPEMKTVREKVLYRYGIKNADRIIVQTKIQQKMLLEGFKLQSEVLPMPCQVNNQKVELKTLNKRKPSRVLWIGRINKIKRLEMLIEIARNMPDINFDVVGGADSDKKYAEKLLDNIRCLKNICVHGKVDRENVFKFYRESILLCCTSKYEGFPNTFLEAWSEGTPVVSTVDPDNLIQERGMGKIGNSTDEIIKCIRILKEDKKMWSKCSINSKIYFDENHAISIAMPRFESLFNKILCKNAGLVH